MPNLNLLARILLILGYCSLYLLLSILLIFRLDGVLIQLMASLLYLVFMGLTFEMFHAALLLSLSGLKGIKPQANFMAFATLANSMHEQADLKSLFECVKTGLEVQFGPGTTQIYVRESILNPTEMCSERMLRWSAGSHHGGAPLDRQSALWQFARGEHSAYSINDCPAAVREEMLALQALYMIPVCGSHGGMCLILQNSSQRPDRKLSSLFQFLAQQLCIAIERIDVQQRQARVAEAAFTEKVEALATLSANIAHEMRTPLSGVRASMSGVDSYLPDLLGAYEFANAADPERFSTIRKEHLNTLSETPRRIHSMVDQANNVIDLLLVNLRQQQLDSESFTSCSMNECLSEALQSYPFKRHEREKVEWVTTVDFEFLGIKSMMIYVFFNLLKNGFYSIEAAGKGSISVEFESNESSNLLHFKDTGAGIKPEDLPYIFDGFFTTRIDGTGAGLAFCKRTLHSFGADIRVDSVSGEYASFTLEFPLLPGN